MRSFRVWLDGDLYRERYTCMGHYDVANELFPSPEHKDHPFRGYANVAEVDRADEKYEFVLLDFDHKRLLIESLDTQDVGTVK